MASTIWKGNLTFGLVSFPVRLVKAARRERVALKYVREEKQDSDEQRDSTGYKQQTSVEQNDESLRSGLTIPFRGPSDQFRRFRIGITGRRGTPRLLFRRQAESSRGR